MSAIPLRIMLVDDEPYVMKAMEVMLQPPHTIKALRRAELALEELDSFQPDLVLLDVRLPQMDGLSCLQEIKKREPLIEVVMVTADRHARTAVQALKQGAFDYLEKPVDEQDLRTMVGNVAEKVRLRRQVDRLGQALSRPYALDQIVGESDAMLRLRKQIEQVARHDLNVLVEGETGTGKELVARAVHYSSPRREQPFEAINCARLGDHLIESELFGHERGAFTGAVERRRGVFEQADGGTLFLDEISSMPMPTQARLLRVLEERQFKRVGGERVVSVNVRVIAATNMDLLKAVDDGTFRDDLFYRLNVCRLRIPPLRERRRDIAPLIHHFLRKHRAHMSSDLNEVRPEAMEILTRHNWRGNVRELENTVLLLMSQAEGPVLRAQDLDLPILRPAERAVAEETPEAELNTSAIRLKREHAEREAVHEALQASGWNQSKAARKLGVHRNTLRRLMERYGIESQRVGGSRS